MDKARAISPPEPCWVICGIGSVAQMRDAHNAKACDQ